MHLKNKTEAVTCMSCIWASGMQVKMTYFSSTPFHPK